MQAENAEQPQLSPENDLVSDSLRTGTQTSKNVSVQHPDLLAAQTNDSANEYGSTCTGSGEMGTAIGAGTDAFGEEDLPPILPELLVER